LFGIAAPQWRELDWLPITKNKKLLIIYATSLFMRLRLVLISALLIVLSANTFAQNLSPRAYVITPTHSNALTVTWSFYDGGLSFNGTVPIKDGRGTYNVPIASYYHGFNFFGRSANVNVVLPYAFGDFTGELNNQQRSVYRSGLLDLSGRFAVNLYGGRAMPAKEFRNWRQRVLLGASLTVVAPTGQYDPTKLINWGINRWAFKPEFGYSQRWGNWILDGYAGVWFYTTNQAFFNNPAPKPQTEAPIGSLEGHLSYDIPKLKGFRRARLWCSLDGNFWWGGITAVNSIRNLETKQTSSRIGGTVSFPLTKFQSVKVAYSDGAYIRFGGNYQNVSVAWQYSWLGTKFK
jgi:hypothetical protein